MATVSMHALTVVCRESNNHIQKSDVHLNQVEQVEHRGTMPVRIEDNHLNVMGQNQPVEIVKGRGR